MILVVIVFIILLMIGTPVGFAIGISGTMFFLQHPELPITTIVQLPITVTQSMTLLAVPLFVFAGSLMNASGITDRLIKLALVLTGHMRGGLAQVSVVLSTLMGGVSGSANADAAMEARVLGPGMEKQGYPKGYTAGVIGFSSLITATIPPGVGLILFGTVGNVSIWLVFGRTYYTIYGGFFWPKPTILGFYRFFYIILYRKIQLTIIYRDFFTGLEPSPCFTFVDYCVKYRLIVCCFLREELVR